MTRDKMIELFEKYSDNEFLEFQRVENPLNLRPDLAAFLLLNSLLPGNEDMVSAAEHDIIYLSIDVDALAAAASEEDVLALVRCGVRLEDEGFSMFV